MTQPPAEPYTALDLLADFQRMIGKTDHWRGWIGEWVGEQPSDAEVVSLLDQAITALREVDQAITPEQAEQLAKLDPCTHCKAIHARACPRVRSLAYHPNGNLAEVKFWPDGKWSTQGLIWPDDNQNQPEP